LTIPLRAAGAIEMARARGAAPGSDDVGPIRLQLLDKRRRTLGEPVLVEPPEPLPVEGRGKRGTPQWSLATPPLSLPLDVPDEAHAVRIEGGGGAPAVFALARIAEARAAAPPQRVERFPAAPARWTLAVVSERFTDADAFFAQVRTLHAFIASQSPFGEAGVSFGIVGLFWPAPPGGTLFGASDNKINGRVLQGDSAGVKRFVAAAGIVPNKVLVLVNSTKRAGAGGFGGDRPSWTTNTADPPERWEGIALHELGHAFGLADEYDAAFNLAEPNPLEPNVSDQQDPLKTSWRHLCNVHAPPAPTALRGQEGAHDLASVGTFQGARYRETDRYRPSPFCRMRMTTFPFCAVCRDHIRAELTR
ncbi:MAG: M64 family metallopeptidase, partial [Novosphingobium sp.]